jgi:hypothetical protein
MWTGLLGVAVKYGPPELPALLADTFHGYHEICHNNLRIGYSLNI